MFFPNCRNQNIKKMFYDKLKEDDILIKSNMKIEQLQQNQHKKNELFSYKTKITGLLLLVKGGIQICFILIIKDFDWSIY